jgi:uncharacterized OB-fold protein
MSADHADGRNDPPQPLPDVDTEAFWQATAGGFLALCRCAQCGAWLHPPLERCRQCAGPTSFVEVSGAGTIAGFIVMHRASVPGQGSVPHAIVLVDLDAAPGVRLTGRLAGADPAQVRVGARVSAAIVDVPGGEYRQPEFRLLDDQTAGSSATSAEIGASSASIGASSASSASIGA